MECPSAVQEKRAEAPFNAQRSLVRLGCGSGAEQLPGRQRPWVPSTAKWGRERKNVEEWGGGGESGGGERRKRGQRREREREREREGGKEGEGQIEEERERCRREEKKKKK